MFMYACEAIPATMPAAVLVGPKKLEVRDIPVWNLLEYEDSDMVLLRVEACGVCGSDFRYYLGENPWAQHTLGRFVRNPPNMVLGHEFAGTVVACRSEENRALLGKRVAPVCSKVCGRCDQCRLGRTRLCPNTVHLGHGQGWGERDYYPGAYARYVPVWGASCYEVPESVPVNEAALMDILAVCLHVAEQGSIQRGAPVLVLGAGPAGNGIAQAAKAMGASRVVLTDLSPEALRIAEGQGVGRTLDVLGLSSEEQAEALGGEFGSVFDTVGTAQTIDLGMRALGKAGTFVNVAVHDQAIPFNFLRLGSERRMVTSCNFEVGDYPRALAWLESGVFRVKDWITPVRLDDLPARFAETAGAAQKGVFKMVVDPWN